MTKKIKSSISMSMSKSLFHYIFEDIVARLSQDNKQSKFHCNQVYFA